ncbi:MAG: hypothetical protein MK135_06715 [Polyangiaceae bacterium]|nr:hypothetical protein [Polyangiaceae bacterium]
MTTSTPHLPPQSGNLREEDWADSLPREYQENFSLVQQAAHAYAAARREPEKSCGALFPTNDPALSGVCVVTDTKQGAFSLLTSAWSELGYEIEQAETYQRSNRPPTTVNLFWVRTGANPLDPTQVERYIAVFDELLQGRPSQRITLGRSSADAPEGTTIRFLEDRQGQLNILEIDTDDRTGLLLAITTALHLKNVQIVSSKIRTHGARVHDRFEINELDGTAISTARRLDIQVALLGALESTA